VGKQSPAAKKKPVVRECKPRPRISVETKQKIIDDWRTGQYTQAELWKKYKVSDAYVAKLVSGIKKDLQPIVSSQMKMFRDLAGLSYDEQELVFSTAKAKCEAIELVNYGMTKAAAFLINKINLQASVGELVGVTTGLKNVRDVVDPVPKQQTNIQFNQTTNLEKSVRDLTDAELKQKVDELFNRVKVINL
jgi:hypothetical protein